MQHSLCALGLCVALASGPVLAQPNSSAKPAPQPATDAATIERGRYLATAGDCISCHTRPDGVPFAGGLPLQTPFGVIYTANITPDTATGIGTWSEAQFARALREGMAADGTALYPAFPYPEYTKVRDADVQALYAYLRSLPAVRYRPPPNRMSFPFGVRSLLVAWKKLFFRDGRYTSDASRSAEWNRGAYLTQGLGHCGACHTPRNVFGAERESLALTGGVYLDEVRDAIVEDQIRPFDERLVRRWSTPNLTAARGGLAAWSLDELVEYLKSGHNARAGAFGPMSAVIVNSTSQLSSADLHAMGVYLKSLPAAQQSPARRASALVLRSGAIVYNTRCVDCHQSTGLGMPRGAGADPSKTAPPLAGSAALQAPDPATLINVILYGAHESVPSGSAWPRMSGFELSVGLDDAQIAALCSYVRSSWGNDASAVDVDTVERQH
ncbi:MAG TPA: cytochrome c [Steroidobacteraceae bacterium]|nr:cytochrome c [Steroidobacteraceae bacterium]